MLLQFRQYSEEYVDEDDDFGLVNYLEYFKNGSLRCDARFLEYEDLWNTDLEDLIEDSYETSFEIWVEDYF